MYFAENIIMNPETICLRREEESGRDVMDFAENIIMNTYWTKARNGRRHVMDFAENIIMNT
jgi:hypothetical protein